jgi:hypothetical protein
MYQLSRQALHAYELELELYGKLCKFQAPIHNDMQKII